MKQLYIDCGMGAAGDMLTAALLQLLPDPERAEALADLNGAGIPGVTFEAVPGRTCGIAGLSMRVRVNGAEEGAPVSDDGHAGGAEEGVHAAYGGQAGSAAEPHGGHTHGHAHRSMESIRAMIAALRLDEAVKRDVLRVYTALAEAESEVHDVPVTEIHFHEVGAMDAVADIAAVAYLLRRIDADRVTVSPVCVGSGTVRCAHGILPVPAPATAALLRGVPSYSDGRRGELCTPTGAALLRTFADAYGPMPLMRVETTGFGIGKREFPWANCVRVMLGESGKSAMTGSGRPEAGKAENAGTVRGAYRTDAVWELSCNLDDMTGEELGFAVQALMDQGALDVWTLPAGMKKSRPGVVLNVLADDGARETLETAMIRLTSTLGVRAVRKERRCLERRVGTVETPSGPVRKKDAGRDGNARSKYEYDDLARIASEQGTSLREAEHYVRRYEET